MMPENGFPKKERLLKRSDYLHLSKTGKKYHRKRFFCILKKGSGQRPRLGITVTKKVGCAVERNRIKRVCREFFRLNRNRLRGIQDINIIAKQGAADATGKQLWTSLNELFNAISENPPSDSYC